MMMILKVASFSNDDRRVPIFLTQYQVQTIETSGSNLIYVSRLIIMLCMNLSEYVSEYDHSTISVS